MMYRVFYRVGREHWQDSLQTFTNGHDAMTYAITWPHSRITNESGDVLAIAGFAPEAPGFRGPFHLTPDQL